MAIVDYIQRHPEVFVGLVGLVFVFNVVSIYIRGRQAERQFEKHPLLESSSENEVHLATRISLRSLNWEVPVESWT